MSTVATRAGVPPSAEPRGFRRLWRIARQLFHEVAGAMFAVLALGWFNSALRAWSRDAAHWLIALPIAVGLLFLAFSLTSFHQARKL